MKILHRLILEKVRNFFFCVQALAAALCMNIYVVGLNQIFDIQIDKVVFFFLLQFENTFYLICYNLELF